MAVIAAFVINAGLNFVLGLLIAKLLGPAWGLRLGSRVHESAPSGGKLKP